MNNSATKKNLQPRTVREKLIRHVQTVGDPYNFQVGTTSVKLVFSDKANAPDIETLLVKIATRRQS